MKLDVNQLRYLSKDDFRVLQAVELGQRNHEIVPVTLVDSIARLKHGGTVRCLKVLLKAKLVHHENVNYDGYRLTYLGYDFLAIKAFVNRGVITSVGRQIGVGKESDIFEVSNEDGEIMALKLHRLGRTSFRAVKSKRDYLKHRNSFSWLYLSRLAALKEFAFMKALGQHDFPVPRAIDNNRHAVLMSMVDAYPLVQVRELENPGTVYIECMDIMARLAAKGLIHCDFNEFNLLIDDEEKVTLIDFPQMVSTSHANAEDLFYRDVECVIRFFKKKIGYIPEHDSLLPYVRPDFKTILAGIEDDLGPELRASGFDTEHEKALADWSTETRGKAATDSQAEDGEGSEEQEESSDSEESADDLKEDTTAIRQEESTSCNGMIDRKDETSAATSVDEWEHAELSSSELRAEQAEVGNGDSDGLDPENVHERQRAEDLETAVREQLVLETRKAKQAQRMRNAVRSAHKAGDKRTRSRGGVNLEY